MQASGELRLPQSCKTTSIEELRLEATQGVSRPMRTHPIECFISKRPQCICGSESHPDTSELFRRNGTTPTVAECRGWCLEGLPCVPLNSLADQPPSSSVSWSCCCRKAPCRACSTTQHSIQNIPVVIKVNEKARLWSWQVQHVRSKSRDAWQEFVGQCAFVGCRPCCFVSGI